MSTSSKLVRINSNDKVLSQSVNNGDFTVNLQDPSTTQVVKGITILQAYAPNVFYNVRSSQGEINNVLYIEQKGGAKTAVSIAEGQYTTTTMIAALKTAIDAKLAGGSVVAIAQDTLTQKLTFTFSTGASPETVLYDAVDGPSTLANVIGLSTTTAEQLVSVMDYLPDLGGYKALYIHSKQLADGNLIDGNSGSVSTLVAIPLNTTAFGAVGVFDAQDATSYSIEYPAPRNITHVNLVLRDSKGNRLDPGTSEIEILIKIYY